MPINDYVRRQKRLADFGAFALDCDRLDDVLTEACRLVADALGTDRAKVLEIEDGGARLFVRAGVGWPASVVGQLRLPMSAPSSEAFSINAGRPIATRDVATEQRFGVSPLMRDAGVVAFVNVPIRLPGGVAYGLLQVDATAPRDFDDEEIEFLRTYTTILGPVIDRLLKLRDFRRTEERFRLTLQEVRDYAIYLTDRDDRITDWLPGAAAVFGWSANEAVGQFGAMLFTPEDRARAASCGELERARRDGVSPNVRWHLRKDGSRVFIEGTVRALHDASGVLTGFLKVGQDVTSRRADESRLRDSEAQLRALVEGVPQLIWRSGDAGHWIWASQQWLDYTGQGQDETHDLGWLNAIHPDDRDATMQAWQTALVTRSLDVKHRVRCNADAQWRWHQTRSLPHHLEAGVDGKARRVEWFGTTTDNEELKRLQDEQSVLVAELQHRTRNLLAVVRNIARRCVPPSPGRDDYDKRLAAIGRVQGFLSRSIAFTASLRDLVEAELHAAGGDTFHRVAFDGPTVELPGRYVQSIALAVHELATNAVKYGALSAANPHGRLRIEWHVEHRETEPTLVITWCEQAIRVAPDASRRSGYGTELITRALPYQLNAETSLRFDSDRLRCQLRLPANTFAEVAEGAPSADETALADALSTPA